VARGEPYQHGEGRPEDIELLDSVAVNIMGRTICALGDAAAMPVRAMIKHFRHEFEAKIQNASKQAAWRLIARQAYG
jgi:NADH-quinone oxidoreductase subunit F